MKFYNATRFIAWVHVSGEDFVSACVSSVGPFDMSFGADGVTLSTATAYPVECAMCGNASTRAGANWWQGCTYCGRNWPMREFVRLPSMYSRELAPGKPIAVLPGKSVTLKRRGEDAIAPDTNGRSRTD